MNELERLRHVLETAGADEVRWPDAERDRLLRLIGGSEEARRLHEEAEALDALLLQAAPREPIDPAVNDRLAPRILADFRAERAAIAQDDDAEEGDGETASGNILAFPGPRPSPLRAPARQSTWMMAMLAACFAFGVFLGGFGVGGWTLDPLGEISRTATGEEQIADLSGLFSDEAANEEDLL